MSRSVLLGAFGALLAFGLACGGGSPNGGPTPDGGNPLGAPDSGVPDAGSPDGGVPDGGTARHNIYGYLNSGNASASPSGVTVQLSGTATATATTNSTGQFTFLAMPDGPYTIDVQICHSFQCNPQTVTVDLQGANANVYVYIVGCSPDESLSGGQCTCAPGLTACVVNANSNCVLTQSDDNNCGACGVKCGSGTLCSNGTCVAGPVLLGSIDGGAQFTRAFCDGIKVANGHVYVNADFADQNLTQDDYQLATLPVDGGAPEILVSTTGGMAQAFDVDAREVIWSGKLDAGAALASVYLQPTDGGPPAEVAQLTNTSRTDFTGAVLDPTSAYFVAVSNPSNAVTATITRVDRSTGAASTLYASNDPYPCCNTPPAQQFSLTGEGGELFLGNPIEQRPWSIQESDGGAAYASSFAFTMAPLLADPANLYAPGKSQNNTGYSVYELPLDGGSPLALTGRTSTEYSAVQTFSLWKDHVYWLGYEDLYQGVADYSLNGLFKTPTDGGAYVYVAPFNPACFTVAGGHVFYVRGTYGSSTLDVYRFDSP